MLPTSNYPKLVKGSKTETVYFGGKEAIRGYLPITFSRRQASFKGENGMPFPPNRLLWIIPQYFWYILGLIRPFREWETLHFME